MMNKSTSYINSSFIQISVIYVLLSLLIVLAYVISTILQIPIEHLSADPAALYGAHPLTGLLSNIGVLFWCLTGSICLFTYIVVKKYSNYTTGRFLLFSGLITFFLCLDDLFMLHEGIFPWHLKIPQTLVYVIYFIVIGSFLLFFIKHIFQGEYIILIIAFFFLGSSVLGDFILPQHGYYYLLEDTLKLFGIGTWFVYFFRYCLKQFDYYLQNP